MTVVSGYARRMIVAGDMINSMDKFQEMNPDRPSWDDTTLYREVEWIDRDLK